LLLCIRCSVCIFLISIYMCVCVCVCVCEWSKRALEDLLSQLTLPEGDSQQEAEVVSMVTGGAGTELERSVDNTPETLQRGRKAGCKNFYWKGFTVC
uniref:Somatostatin-2 n=1 Tax=Gadus morhua TaxID=8049 RepID=A0A8C5CW26_GADMO